MLKSGNFDASLNQCSKADSRQSHELGFRLPPRSLQYGHSGPMNQPVIHNQWSSIDTVGMIRGGFNGSYDNFSNTVWLLTSTLNVAFVYFIRRFVILQCSMV